MYVYICTASFLGNWYKNQYFSNTWKLIFNSTVDGIYPFTHTSHTLGGGCKELTMHICEMRVVKWKSLLPVPRKSNYSEYSVGQFSRNVKEGTKKEWMLRTQNKKKKSTCFHLLCGNVPSLQEVIHKVMTSSIYTMAFTLLTLPIFQGSCSTLPPPFSSSLVRKSASMEWNFKKGNTSTWDEDWPLFDTICWILW